MNIRYITRTVFSLMAVAQAGCSAAGPANEQPQVAQEQIRNGDLVTPFGPNSAPNESKAVVSVGSCTGTVVKPSWVLTARHCAIDVGAFVTSYRPGADGVTGSSRGGVTRTVDAVNNDVSNDVTLLHVSQPFTDIPQVSIYNGPTTNLLGNLVTCYGYGGVFLGNACTSDAQCDTTQGQHCLNSGCQASDTLGQLHSATLPVSSWVLPAPTDSTPAFDFVQVRLTPNSNNQETLQGDSGGPCMFGNQVALLASANNYSVIPHEDYEASLSVTRDSILSPSRVAYTTGDFDGNGREDVIITNAFGSFWYYSMAPGVWDTSYQRPELQLGKVVFTTGNFDGLNGTDLIITTSAGSFWYIRLVWQGSGTRRSSEVICHWIRRHS